jgi:hypothetical protein
MAHIDRRNRGGTIRYVARYIDPAGRERSKSFTRRADAQKYLTEIEAAKLKGIWVDPSTAGPGSRTGMTSGGGVWSTCGRRPGCATRSTCVVMWWSGSGTCRWTRSASGRSAPGSPGSCRKG